MQLTASRFRLVQLCAYWARPEVTAPNVDVAGRPAKAGSALHEVLESYFRARGAGLPTTDIMSMAPSGIAKSERAMIAECLSHFVEHRVSKIAWMPEQAFAYDPATDTARMLPTDGHRDYSALLPGEIPGTPDAYFWDAKSRTVYVPDWKTTTGMSNDAYAESARAQGDFNALAVARAFGAVKATAYKISMSPDGIVAEQRDYSSADLDAVAETVRAVVAGIPTSQPVPGFHCADNYCPAVARCPATTRWQAALVPSDIDEGLMFDPQTPEHYAAAIHAFRSLKAMAEWIKAALDEKVDLLPSQSVTLPNGQRYERCEKNPRSIDLSVPGVVEAIEGAGLGSAITREVSLGGLAKAARERGYRGKEVEQIVDALLSGLDSLKAVESRTVVSHEIKGKKALPGPSEAD